MLRGGSALEGSSTGRGESGCSCGRRGLDQDDASTRPDRQDHRFRHRQYSQDCRDRGPDPAVLTGRSRGAVPRPGTSADRGRAGFAPGPAARALFDRAQFGIERFLRHGTPNRSRKVDRPRA